MGEIVLKHKQNLKLFLVLFILLFPLYLEAISSNAVNKLIQFNEFKNLRTLKTVDIIKPTKKIVQENSIKEKEIRIPQKTSITQGKYESTKEFQQRLQTNDDTYQREHKHYLAQTKNEKQRVKIAYNKALKDADTTYKKALIAYNIKLQKEKNRKNKHLKYIRELRGKTLDDALLIYLGKPKLSDFSNYNPDSEIFTTKIISSNLVLPIELHINRREAQKLDKTHQLKKLKPIVTFEYSNNHLYISNIKVKLKSTAYQVSLLEIKDYNTDFKLNYKVADRFIKWNNRKITDKALVQAYSKIGIFPITHGIYKDKKRHLTWQDNKDVVHKRRTYNQALKYCKNLQLDHKKGWRLPTKKELLTLVDTSEYNPAIISSINNIVPDYYWVLDSTNDKAWYINFQLGEEATQEIGNKNYVRCVLSTDFFKHINDNQ